jgi:histone H3/H4
MGKSTRTHRKAGLALPSHIVKKMLRAHAPGKRMQKNVEVIITSVVDRIIKTILTEAAVYTENDTTRLKSIHLYKALQNPKSQVANLLRRKIAGIYSLAQDAQTQGIVEPQLE